MQKIQSYIPRTFGGVGALFRANGGKTMTYQDLYELFIATAQDPGSEEELKQFLAAFKRLTEAIK